VKVAWSLVLGPTEEPIELADAKLHLRQPESDEDSLVTRMVRGTRATAEGYLGRGLLPQTWKYTQDGWTETMALPMAAPLQSVTVQYYDGAGVLQTLAPSAYVLDTISEPAVVRRAPNQSLADAPVADRSPRRRGHLRRRLGRGRGHRCPTSSTACTLLLTRRYERRGEDAPEDVRRVGLPWRPRRVSRRTGSGGGPRRAARRSERVVQTSALFLRELCDA
jgi:uncharacterized phiE125 gp8 family phage protein